MLQEALDYFQSIPSIYRTLILAAGLLFFWLLEGAIPFFALKYAKLRHALVNIFFTLTTLVVNFALAFLIIKTCDFTSRHEFGILYVADLPLWLHVVLGVLLLDFIGAYFIHWLEHKVRWMWKFHLIHHTDTNVDVTTGLRHHPGESIFRALFTTLAILVAGVPVGIVMLYQTMSAFFAQITHANIRTPEKVDRSLSLIFVTPRMHKVHHHYVQPLTDTNYGNIFSLWDHLFGTFAYVADSSTLRYGIDTHMQESEYGSLKNLLAIPFQKYRPPTQSKFGRPQSQEE